MDIVRAPLNPYDTMMPEQFREAERTLPATDPKVLAANLDWFLDHEEEDPIGYGQRIKDISERLGC